MAQPTPYTREYSFTDFAAGSPTAPPPGDKLDAEFNAILVTLAGVLANLAIVQRDDGALANNTVTLDALAPDVLTIIGASLGWTPTGAWATAHSYAIGDVATQGTGTYVCAVAHTSGTFATDLAANKWNLIFDSAAAAVADGSITTFKLADGAVTSAKLNISSLDLSGSLRAATGIAAGTETAGTYAIGAKLASGNVTVSVARDTRSQGSVGFRIDGGTSGSVWTLAQASGSDNLVLASSLSGRTIATLNDAGGSEWGGTLRVQGSVTPSTGAGIEVSYSSSTGFVGARDRGAATWKDLKLQGSAVVLTGGGVDVLSATSAGVAIVNPSFTGTPIEDTYTITDAAGFEIDPANGSVQQVTLGASRTPKATNFKNGQSVTLAVDDGTAFSLTWTDATFGGSGVKWIGVAPTLGTTGWNWISLWKMGGQVFGLFSGNSG